MGAPGGESILAMSGSDTTTQVRKISFEMLCAALGIHPPGGAEILVTADDADQSVVVVVRTERKI